MTEPSPPDAMPSDLRQRLDEVLRGSSLPRLLGMELLDWSPGRARLRMPTTAAQANLAGSVHGGVLFALADAAFEAACNSHGRRAVALETTVHYTAPAPLGETLVAEAVEESRSRRTASYRVEVSAEAGERRMLALALAYRTQRWHLGEDAWPEAWRLAH